MNIEDISKKVFQFQKKNFERLKVDLTPEIIFIHLNEEVGEIAREIINKNSPIREFDKDNLKKEISQAIMDLFVLSELFDVDLSKIFDEKLSEIENRISKEK